MTTRRMVNISVFAGIYLALVTIASPIAFGPLQLRLAGLLIPLVLFDPSYALGYALGVAMANLLSPFGPWDWLAMPLVSLGAGLLAWQLRRLPGLALALVSLITAAGVAALPLGLGAGLPFLATFPPVLVSQTVVVFAGYLLIWRMHAGILRRVAGEA